jgi:hypothetical protein
MESYSYVDITRKDREKELSSFFMVNCFLKSRINLNMESNATYFDEDVNVYIAMLLDSAIHTNGLNSPALVSRYDSEIARKMECVQNTRDKYNIYKNNADSLLLSLGIFEDLGSIRGSKKPFYHIDRKTYIGRARVYYQFAAIYAERLFGKSSGICTVLRKLSYGFDKYLTLLQYMKKEYLNLQKGITRGEKYHLQKLMKSIECKDYITQRRDEFLDLYSLWLKTKKPTLIAKMNSLLEELKEIDPEFHSDKLKFSVHCGNSV